MTHRLTTIIAAVLCMLPAAGARLSAAPSLPIALSQYDRILSEAQTDAYKAVSGGSGAQAAAAEIRSVAQVAVRANSGGIVIADNRPILAQMQAAQRNAPGERATKWREIASELGDVRSALGTGTTANPDRSVPEARAVLSRPEFASEPIVVDTFWTRIGDAIGRFFDRIFKPVKTKPVDMGPIPSWVTDVVPDAILTILIVLAVGLIAYFIATAVRNRQYSTSRQSHMADSDLALTSEERVLVETHNYTRLHDLADEAAGRGDFRSAFRLIFLATLVFLDFEGAIKLNRSKTNWEYLRSLTEHEEVRSHLRPIVRDFDRIWYGYLDATSEHHESAKSAYEAVRETVNAMLAGADSSSGARKAERTAASR